MIISSKNIFAILAIMKVFENLLNFFSLALNNKVTEISVIPVKSNNNKGQNFVINPAVRSEKATATIAMAAVYMIRLRINRFTNSFMLNGVQIMIIF